MLYYVRSRGQKTRYRSGIKFGPEAIEIDTEGMSQKAVDAILNDGYLLYIPYTPESETAPEPEIAPEPEVVSEAEASPDPEVVEIQQDEVETKAKAKKSRAKSASNQEQAE